MVSSAFVDRDMHDSTVVANKWPGGEEWQRFINAVLLRHYGAGAYQCVPADYVGDYGVEGYSIPDRQLYQCYAAKGPVKEKDLHELQREKINADLKTMCQNIKTIYAMLGHRILRWVLVVPHHGSAPLVRHCAKKTKELRGLRLPELATGFRVMVHTDEAWKLEADEVRRGLALLDAPTVPSDAIALNDWEQSHGTFVENVRRKARRLTTPDALDGLVRSYVAAHIEGQNVLAHIQSQAGEEYARLIAAKAAFEADLVSRCAVPTGGADTTFWSIVAKYEDLIKEQCPTLSPATRLRLRQEGVADWLMRCNLYFGESDG
jgi:hypothetical protein